MGDIKSIVNGENTDQPTAGFIIDCPWIPEWYGISALLNLNRRLKLPGIRFASPYRVGH